MSLTGVLNSHLMMAHLTNRFGTQEQRDAFLPLLASGELRGGLALTEPDCGTDLQAIRTLARREGDGYLVTGNKTWITNGGQGNALALLVKTDLEAKPRHTGMSMLLVKKDDDGYQIGRKLGKLGYKGVDTVEVFFDEVFVPGDRLLGGTEGQGFAQAQGGLELGRINVAARGVGLANAALQASLRYSTERQTMGKPIGQHQAIQLKLADMACRVASSRLLRARRRRRFDAGRALRPRGGHGEAGRHRSCAGERNRGGPHSRRATATPPMATSSVTTATRRCSASAKARTRSSGSSSPANSSRRPAVTVAGRSQRNEGRYFEDFTIGDVFQHPLGRTLTDTDNVWFTLLTMNTNELHFNADFASRTEHGREIVNSGLTVAMVLGLSVSDISQNAIANLGWDDIRLTAPVFVGDTLYAESIVTDLRESKSRPHAGIVSCFTRGLNQDGVEVLSYRRSVMVFKQVAGSEARRFPAAAVPVAERADQTGRRDA